MKLTILLYRRLAIFLWGLVFAMVGWSYANYFQWGQRKAIFFSVLAVGVYALFMLQKVDAEKNDAVVGVKDTSEKVMRNNEFVVGELQQSLKVEKASPDKQITQKTTSEERNRLRRGRLDEFLFIQQDR